MSDVIVAPEVRDLAVLAQSLETWLAPRLPEAREIRVHDIAYPFGAGQSHETILFDLSWTEAGARRSKGCVVRIKPTRHTVYPETFFEEQYLVMQALHDQGRVRVARPLWFEPDPTILGAPFFIMEKVRGRVPVSIPLYVETGWVAEATPDQRRAMSEDGVRQLAAISSTPLSSLGFLAGPHGLSGLEQEWDRYVRFVDWVSEGSRRPPLAAAIAKLERNWPKNRPSGLVWGDARIGNMMFGDDFKVVAVVDWEQPSLGGALHDLAWWLTISAFRERDPQGRPLLDGLLTREETIALWRETCGISTADLDWYEDFARLKIACTSIRMSALGKAPAATDAELARRLGV